MHGGLSTGPKTDAGKDVIRAALLRRRERELQGDQAHQHLGYGADPWGNSEMRSHLFTKQFLVALFASGAWYSWLLWALIVILWLLFVMFLVDSSAP